MRRWRGLFFLLALLLMGCGQMQLPSCSGSGCLLSTPHHIVLHVPAFTFHLVESAAQIPLSPETALAKRLHQRGTTLLGLYHQDTIWVVGTYNPTTEQVEVDLETVGHELVHHLRRYSGNVLPNPDTH